MLKPSVAIALIIAGVVLLTMPPISDHLWRADAVRLMLKTGIANVHLEGQMDPAYRFGCFVAGATAIGIAVAFSIQRADRKATPTAKSSHDLNPDL